MATTVLIAALLSATLDWGHVAVKQVNLDAPGALSVAQLRRTFGVVPPSLLSRVEIRRGVQALVATGQVEDVVVDVSEEAGGAVVAVHVQVASRVRSLEVSGFGHSSNKRVRALLGLSSGMPLHVAPFNKALQRVRQRLRDDGYPEARVDPNLVFDVPHGTVDVQITGELGPPRVAEELQAPGSQLAPASLWERCAIKRGQRITLGLLDRARRRLAASLRRDGFWEAEVDTPEVQESDHHARIALTTRLGPPYRLELEGERRSKSLVKEALPFLVGDEPFNEAALDDVVHRVKLWEQRRGKLTAQASGEIVAEGETRVLRLHVDPGPTTAIREIRFPGAAGLSPKDLREKVGVRRGHPWRWGGEPVDDDSLAADASSLLVALQEAGYSDAKVEPARIVPQAKGVVIEFPVEEGERRSVASLDVEGVPADVKVPKLPLPQGGPWSEVAEIRARDAVEAALQDAGYADARTDASHQCADSTCNVVLHAEPGVKVVVDRVVIAGLTRTHRSVVEKVAGLHSGMVLGPTAELQAQRRLLALGIFQHATVHPIPGQEAGKRRGYVLDLAEAPSRGLSLGVGWDTVEKVRVSASWSQLDLFGTGRTLSFLVRLSSRQRLYEVDYREPARLGVLGFPTWLSVYRSDEDYTTYSLLRRGMWVEFGDPQRRPARALLRYDYQIVNPTAPPEVLSQLERDKQRLAIASITPILEWDSRDNLFSPHRGAFLSVQFQSAFKAFLGDATFNKLSTTAAGFQPLGSGVLVGSVRWGAMEPRPDRRGKCDLIVSPDNCANLAIPISERFFGGGPISHRAFGIDDLGIPGQTLSCPNSASTCSPRDLEPVGGNGELLTSLEWRVPIFGVLGADVFVDGGNIWASWRDIRLADMRWGAGLGLRVETPVGAVRLEYGWKLDRKPGETAGALFLSFGNPF
jgi:outer membrane protein insertion porin family